MPMTKFFITSLLTLTILASCKSNSISSNSNSNELAAANQWILTVGGTRYVWQAYAAKISSQGITEIIVNSRDTVSFTDKVAGFVLTNISSPGTYDIGVLTKFADGYIVPAYTAHDTTDYSTPGFQPIAVGKITITELTANSLKATFNETLTKVRGIGDSTVTITNGSVNVTF